MRTTIDFGIDLGTTNSAIAVFDAAGPRVLAPAEGEALLPSAIWLGPDGGTLVGTAARARFEADPQNTALEFKRLMGSAETRAFPASGRALRAEEMSALVLRALLGNAEKSLGEVPSAAVITVPAMFQLPQCDATQRAAELAGLVYAPLLQEPIAAAIAHGGTGHLGAGYWLVYDLGGGTFDVSLVRSRDGRLQVLDHDGDNHLGGRDLDRAVVRWALERAQGMGKLTDVKRSDEASAPLFAALKAEAERVRIALSTVETCKFRLAEAGLELAIDRGELESILAPTVERTMQLASRVLARGRVGSGALHAVVMVGGPTRTPMIPAALRRHFGVEANHLVDPMIVVAAGAAIYASTQRVPLERRATAPVAPDEVVVDLKYEPMTTDPTPLVVGRLVGDTRGAEFARCLRTDGAFATPWLPVDGRGGFSSKLELRRDSTNVFAVELRANSGRRLRAQPASFRIIHGFSVSKPPLSQSIGVLLAGGTVSWYVRKGASLPTRQQRTHSTTIELRRGQSGDAVHVPIVQGESNRGERNKVVGVLHIRAEGISRDLPLGSEVQVTLTIDESSRATAKAFVPLLDQEFTDVMRFELEAKTADVIKAELASTRSRLEELASLAESLEGDDGSVDARVAEMESLVGEGDRDALDVADQLMRAMAEDIDVADARGRAAAIEKRFQAELARARDLAQSQHGSPTERAQVDALATEYGRARELGDLDEAEKKCDELEALGLRILFRVPQFWKAQFEGLSARLASMPEGAAAAPILEAGRRALERNSISDLASACWQLIERLPKSERSAASAALTSHVR